MEAGAAFDYLLGPVRIETAGKRILVAASGERLAADTQQVEVLLCLIRAYPRIVTKDELIEQVWGGRYVTEAALHKTVSMLRKLLRDQHGGAELIETRYRRGYQLTCAAQSLPPAERATTPTAEASETPALVPGLPPSQNSGSPLRRHALLLMLLAGCGLLAAIFWWGRDRPDMPGAAEVAPAAIPVAVADPAVIEALRQLDEAGLLQAIKDGLSSDPGFVAAAIAELRKRAEGDARLLGLADKYAGIVAYRAGDFATARMAYERALAHFGVAAERFETANVLNNLAVLLAETGTDPELAEAKYRESLDLRVAIGDRAGILASHRNLSNLLLESARYERARIAVAAYELASEQYGEAADRVEARILRGDVELASAEGEPRAAFETALAMATEAGLPMSAASASQRLGRVALLEGDALAARRAFEQALELYRQSGNVHQLDVVLYNLATAVAAQGLPEEALRHFQAVLDADPEAKASALRVDARLHRVNLLWVLDARVAAAAELEAAGREALSLQNDSAIASVLISKASAALLESSNVAARGLLLQAQQRLADKKDWELERNLRYLDILLRIASGEAASAKSELDRLAGDARLRRDRSTEHRIEQARVMLAMAEDDFASAYRWHLRSQAWAPVSAVAAGMPNPAAESTVAAPQLLPWGPVVGVVALASLLGWAVGRRQGSKPFAKILSVPSPIEPGQKPPAIT